MNIVEQLREIIRSLYGSFINIDSLVSLLVSVTMIAFWVLIALVVSKLVKVILLRSKSLEAKFGKKESREQLTVRRLINNVIQFFFYFWIVIMIVGELGVDVLPILAGAGVLAFAIGFGAQELIKDIIAGMFLILEKTFRIGDYVEIGSHTGTVIDVGLRRLKIENWKGEVITINNGDIRTIKNFSINPSYAVIEFKTDYDFKVNEFDSEEFRIFLDEFKQKHKDILEMPSKILLNDVNEGLKFSVHIKTKTRKHVAIEREFRKELITYFQNKNIDIVVPLVIVEGK